MTRDEVQEAARDWIGTPYMDRGRTRQGVDCIGFLVVVGRHFNIPHVDPVDYAMWPSQQHLILKGLGKYLLRQPINGARLPGLVGAFAEQRLPGHCGIFSEKHGAPHLIHARMHPRKVIEEPWEPIPREKLRLIALFAFPGLEL